MRISGRYKLVTKKRYARLDIPVEQVKETFNKVIQDSSLPLLVSIDRKTGIYKVLYKISQLKKDVYENYCLLVELKKIDEGTTRIEYDFVYDRAVSYYTKTLSIICILAPVLAAIIASVKFNAASFWLYIPLALIAGFGVFSLFGFKERKKDIIPVIEEFEQLLLNTFSDEDKSL